MRGVKIALTLLVIGAMAFYTLDSALARSTSLTTTIIITVKNPDPKGALDPKDKDAQMIRELAKNQGMMYPRIRQVEKDAKFFGGKVYTITDKL